MSVVTSHGYYAHPSAIIEDGATVGQDSKVWHFAHIRAGASIGRDCTLGKDVFVDAGVHIGSECKIQNGVSVYAGVTIEDQVFVGPHAVFTNDRLPRAFTSSWDLVETRVLLGSSIGANATIVCGVVIGSYAMVGAGSVVTRDVNAHELVVGNPARHAGWVCRCGRLCSREDAPPVRFECDVHDGHEETSMTGGVA
jgi:UDP-2-acetamido-3-amino-2,3-dideoxy-glucuronate N-acetyltransferase